MRTACFQLKANFEIITSFAIYFLDKNKFTFSFLSEHYNSSSFCTYWQIARRKEQQISSHDGRTARGKGKGAIGQRQGELGLVLTGKKKS